MILLTQRDFESKAGQEKILKTIHQLEAKLHDIEIELHKLQQKEELFEHESQGPETY